MSNSFSARATLSVAGQRYEIFRLPALEAEFKVSHLPFSMRSCWKICCASKMAKPSVPTISVP